MNGVHVEIPDFEASQVLGLTLWKQQSQSQYVEQCDIELSDPEWIDGEYVIEYYQSCVDGTNSRLLAEVTGVGDGGIRFRLEILSGTVSGTYRASSWNALGESDLSNSVQI
jgi:hypothetical protein